MLTAKARRAADLLEPEIQAADTRRVLDLIDRFGLSSRDRIQVVAELDRRARHVPDDVELRFDRFDRATLAAVWERGVRAKRRVP